MYNHPDLLVLLAADRRRELEETAARVRMSRRNRVSSPTKRPIAADGSSRPRRFRLLQLARRRPSPAPAA